MTKSNIKCFEQTKCQECPGFIKFQSLLQEIQSEDIQAFLSDVIGNVAFITMGHKEIDKNDKFTKELVSLCEKQLNFLTSKTKSEIEEIFNGQIPECYNSHSNNRYIYLQILEKEIKKES